MNYSSNPFCIQYGIIPNYYIGTPDQEIEIIDTFNSEHPSSRTYIISAVRGSGKTVLLSHISEVLKNDNSWIVINLTTGNSSGMLEMLEQELSKDILVQALYTKPELEVSAGVINLKFENNAPSSVHMSNIRTILKFIKGKRKLLITIDDVVNNENVREMTEAFQSFLIEGYDVFLLMTGLYENIEELEEVKNLTFLIRAPRIKMTPLDTAAITDKYVKAFNITEAESKYMAALTVGYPFAFQALGYERWLRRGSSIDEILPYLDERIKPSYEMIWKKLSAKDKKILTCMAENEDIVKVQMIRELAGMESNEFAVYRDRLLKKGIVKTEEYGTLKFALPRFADFVRRNIY